MVAEVSRRAFLKTAGAVIVAFGLPGELRAQTPAPIPWRFACATFDATGARLRTLPFTPERVRAAFG